MKTVELLHGIGVPRTVDQGGGIRLKPSWRVAPSQGDQHDMLHVAADDAAWFFRHFGPLQPYACCICGAPFCVRPEFEEGRYCIDHGEITYLSVPDRALRDTLRREAFEADWLRLLLSIHEQPSDWEGTAV